MANLTERQKQLVISSFLKTEQISDDVAEAFYNKLFEYDPSLKPLFTGDIKAQGKMLMSALKIAVNSLHNLERLIPVLQNMAIKHVEYGVKCEDYTPVGNALLFALRQSLDGEFTQELKQAWVTTYSIIADVMRSAAYPDYNSNSYQNTKNYKK